MPKQIDIQWPFKGLDEANTEAGSRNTTTSCLNIVGFDPVTGRNQDHHDLVRNTARSYYRSSADGALRMVGARKSLTALLAQAARHPAN
jgi:hypothetical protein